MGVLPVDMMQPVPQEPKPQEKPKQDENEIFHAPPKKETETNEMVQMDQTAIEEAAIPPQPQKAKVKKARGKSDPEHLKKMREASALRRAERKKEKEEAERIIAEAKVLREQQLAQRMGGNPNQEFDYDKLAEAMDRRRQRNAEKQQPTATASTPKSRESAPVQVPPAIDYKKKYEESQIKLFEEKVRADERKRIKQERESKMKNVAANNLRVPKALQKYQQRSQQYAENNKDNPWDSFFK